MQEVRIDHLAASPKTERGHEEMSESVSLPRLNYYGRRQIFTDVKEITDDDVLKVLTSSVAIHEQNRQDIQFLYGYYCGEQNILYRKKEVRPEINNKIVENHAAEIVNFKTGFTFGEPVQYVYRGKDTKNDANNVGDDEGIAYLNLLMEEENKATLDSELAEWFYICGIAFRMALLEKDQLHIYNCDPRNTFVVYSNDYKKEPVLACTYIEEGNGRKLYSVWSNNHFWVIENLTRIIKSQEFATGIPIVEYRLSPTRQGSFEIVLPLIDALNNLASNRMDGVEQQIQSLIWFNNCEVDDESFAKLRDKGGISTKSSPNMPANIQLLQTTLDQQQSQTQVDNTYQMMLTIAAVPDRRASAGGNTGQALIIGEGWTMAESAAKKMELQFKRSEKRFLSYALRALKSVNVLKNLSLGDISIKFTRNKTDNMLTKTQGLQNQLEAGVHPRIAIAHCDLYSDPEQVYLDSEEYLQKWKNTGEQEKAAANITPAITKVDEDLNAILSKLGGGGNNGESDGDRQS